MIMSFSTQFFTDYNKNRRILYLNNYLSISYFDTFNTQMKLYRSHISNIKLLGFIEEHVKLQRKGIVQHSYY